MRDVALTLRHLRRHFRRIAAAWAAVISAPASVREQQKYVTILRIANSMLLMT